jgi:hypothetical protein
MAGIEPKAANDKRVSGMNKIFEWIKKGKR